MTAPAGPRYFEEARVVFRRDLPNGYFTLGLASPRVAASAKPGQFAMVSVRPPGAPGYDPLLPRPFTFLRVDGDVIELFLRAVGRGTVLLSRVEPGDRLTVLGPLGVGFTVSPGSHLHPLFVAGGIGVAPFLHLAGQFRAEVRPTLLYGGRSAGDIHLVDELERAGLSVEVSTEDGSMGESGRVTGPLSRWLARGEPLEIFTCGPERMMDAVVRLAKGVKVQASLEARMACGIGVCRGCAVALPGGGYLEVCVDGPVRDGHEVFGDGRGP